jgi:hypothetical protein
MLVDMKEYKVPASFVWVRVCGLNGQPTAINIPVAEYDSMLRLARGSGDDAVARVSEACRDAADRLRRKGHTGSWSTAVRRRALSMLRGSYMPSRAAMHTE